jgi:iron complex outermembrane receptor protein
MSSRAQTSAEVFGTGFLNSGSQTQMSGRVVGVELQNHVGFGRHDLSLIGMARWTMSDITPSGTVITAPSRRTDRELNASFQDDIALPGELTLTVGAKFEDSTMATFQVEPTVRIAWRANESHSLWAAVSRAARTPSHYELDSTLKPLVQQLPEGVGVLTIFGNPALDAEHMIAYEAGYRAQWHRGLSVDTALFFNRYNGLIESVPGLPFVDAFSPFVRIALPSTWMNVADETTYGLEARARYQVRPAWVVDTSYSWLHEESPDSTVAYNDPNHQWQIGSNVTLARVWEAGARLYVMGRVPANGIQAEIEPYARLDAQVSRALSSRVSLSVVGQNLTHDSHTEASLFGLLQAQSIQRSAHVRLTWRF